MLLGRVFRLIPVRIASSNVPDQRTGALERTLYRLSEALCKGLSREQHAARLNYHLKPDPRVLICQPLQRLREWRNEEALAIQAALGDRVHEMFRVDGFATHPAKRHRGYGSALLAASNVRVCPNPCHRRICGSNLRTLGGRAGASVMADDVQRQAYVVL